MDDTTQLVLRRLIDQLRQSGVLPANALANFLDQLERDATELDGNGHPVPAQEIKSLVGELHADILARGD